MSVHEIIMAAAGASSAAPSDPYFEYNTLLLTGDGTNGAQNNTFLDSSTNNFTITRNGNTTQGTFSPYGNLWSNYFDGSGDSVQAPSSTLWTWAAASAWTFEAWIYPTSLATIQPIYAAFSTPNNGELVLNTSGNVVFRYWTGVEQKVTTSATVTLNTWSHIAFVYDGTNLSIYINGTRYANAVKVSGADTSTNPLNIGTSRYGSSGSTQTYFTGYISNVRVVNGTALYTSNFTPSTTPLTAVSGTSLLTCQSNRFIDNSSNNFTLTRNGDVKVQRFSPFNPTAPYDAATIGGSGYFDGTGDYLTVPDNAALNLSSGSWTIEGFVYLTGGASNYKTVISKRSGGTAEWEVGVDPSNYLYFYTSSVYVATSPMLLNAWNHFAVVYNGTNLVIYQNGVAVKTQAGVTAASGSSITYIGNIYFGSQAWFGNISNLRVVKGTAVYTTNFTPPTAPLTAITNTSLLCNFTNAGIPDAAMMNNLETVGNAQVSTSVKKYGTGSLKFDGTGDWLTSNPATTDLYAFGTGDFTIEMWVYFNNVTTSANIYETRSTGAESNRPVIYVASNTIRFYSYPSDLITSGSITTGTWYHLAVCRASGTTKMFLNGTQTGSSYTDGTNYGCSANRPFIGTFNSSSGFFNGYIDDLRITKGYARYTANFTPPTAALPTY